MTVYLDPDILSDETAVAEAILAALADQLPDWEPAENSPETAMGEAMGVISATLATLLKDESRDVFSGVAQALLGIARGAGGVATATSMWTVTPSTQAREIPDGSEFVLDTADGTPIAFATVGDTFVPADATSIPDVPVVALEPGPEPNGLTGPGRDFESLPWVTAVELMDAAAGGADPEALDAFVARAADRARRVRVMPITANDYAAESLDMPFVDRCWVVNLLDLTLSSGDGPDSGELDSVGHLTLFPILAGQPISEQSAATLVAYLTGEERPLNVRVHIGAPEYTDISVAITIRLEPGADEEATTAAVAAAITAYFDRSTWGYDEDAPGKWRVDYEPVRDYDVSNIADSIDDVAGVVACTINGERAVEMFGWAPLPNLVDLVITVA